MALDHSYKIALLRVCLGHVALFIKHADDRPVRARPRTVCRVRDRAADCVGSCIPDWAVLQPIADQIKAVPVLAGTDLVNVLGGDSRHFHRVVCSPKSLSDGLEQPKAVLFGTRGFHIFHHVHNWLISLPLFWPSLMPHREESFRPFTEVVRKITGEVTRKVSEVAVL